MKINEIFYSIQGEIDVGLPSIFIRFSGCNLIKEDKGCSWCDTKYAEIANYKLTPEEVCERIKDYPCNNIVITGGEPLFQSKELKQLLMTRHISCYNIYIETNGTIFDNVIFDLPQVYSINCSPKKQFINYNVLQKLSELNKTRFKFVYENKNDPWWYQVINKVAISRSKIWIMPQGATRKEQIQKSPEVIEYCKQNGYNFSPRLQTLVYDTKRGV